MSAGSGEPTGNSSNPNRSTAQKADVAMLPQRVRFTQNGSPRHGTLKVTWKDN